MKTTHLLGLLLTLTLLLGTALTIYADVNDEDSSLPPLVDAAWLVTTESGRNVSTTASADAMIPPSTCPMCWRIETVDSVEWVNQYTSLALDGAGHPHISYSSGGLKYAWHDGMNWHIETVDREVGRSTSLALDEAGHPHISYKGSDDLKYAWHDGTNWHIEIVDSQGDVSEHSSLALDEAGHPHISYGDKANYDLKYTWHDGTNWHIETVDSVVGPYWFIYTTLALDEAGHPHIGYYDSLYYDLKYARHDGTTWHIEAVDLGGSWSETYASLALDEAGLPHISYYNGYPHFDLRYAWRDETNWHIETVDSVGLQENTYTSLALDEAGHPHISYRGNSDLKYAWHDGTTWQIEAVDSEGDVGEHSSLALDRAGHPHISYKGSGDLKYAWWTPLSLDKQASFDGVRLYNGDLLTYTLAFAGPGLNVHLWDPLPDTVHYVSGSLTSTLTPPAVYSPTARAIVWQGRLPTDTIGVARFQVTVDVGNVNDKDLSLLPLANTAWLTATESGDSVSATASVDVMIPPSTDPTCWQIETVDSMGWWRAGWNNSSLALDEVGHPHLSYSYDTDGDLKYAWHNGVNWHIETIDSNVGDSSLMLDTSGHPHISYCKLVTTPMGRITQLRYAWHDGTTWHIRTVDSEGEVGRHSSLALDEAGHPHVSYFDETNSDLKYAWHNGTDWHIETVDSQGDVGTYTSLALDDVGHPHISYYDHTNSDLKYIWHDGTTWHFETVDSEGYVGEHTSLAMDGAGRPHISYRDSTNDDLKHAWHDGTTWHIETVDSQRGVGEYSSLALDEVGHPHISYYDRDNDNLEYAWHDGTNWHIETVNSEGDVNEHSSLALDEAGHLHISYAEGYFSSTLKYARRLPCSLDKQVASSDSPDDANALTHTLTYSLTLVGPDLNARLRDPLPDDVDYVPGSITSTLTPPAVYSPTLDAVTWEGVLPLGTVQTVRFQVSLGVTNARFLSVPLSITNTAWMDDLTYDKRVLDTAVATITPPPFELAKQVTPIHGLRGNDTLTYTLTLYGPGLRARLWDPLPPSVRYVSGSLTDTIGSISGTLTLPAAVYSPTAHAILWQGTLPTDTVEVIRFQATPGITGTGSLSLSLPIVNTAWMTATESGRRISATVIVNGYYLYLPVVVRPSQ